MDDAVAASAVVEVEAALDGGATGDGAKPPLLIRSNDDDDDVEDRRPEALRLTEELPPDEPVVKSDVLASAMECIDRMRSWLTSVSTLFPLAFALLFPAELDGRRSSNRSAKLPPCSVSAALRLFDRVEVPVLADEGSDELPPVPHPRVVFLATEGSDGPVVGPACGSVHRAER